MKIVELINLIVLLLFTAGLVATTFAIGRRIRAYYKEGMRPPLLAWRDMALVASLAFPFLLILIVRAFGLANVVVGHWWWSVITGLPAIIGVMQFAYVEYFIIEQHSSRGYDKVMTEVALRILQEQEEDKDFGDKRRALEEQHLKEREEDGVS